MVVLNEVQARVLGCLVEKEITTPEYYPLSLNALVNACNQKSSRDPVMAATERDVRGALNELEDQGLVRVLADARVPKFEHRMRDGMGGPSLRRDEVAVVCQLLLRGSQTPGELRARADRLYSFDDTAAVQGTLERLTGREEPLVRVMARQPGSREARWCHLLSGPVVENASAPPYEEPQRRVLARGNDETVDRGDDEAWVGRVAALEEQVRTLTERLEALQAQLGS